MKGVANKDKHFCNEGHALSGSNLYVYPKTGYRGCKKCRALSQSKYEEDQKTNTHCRHGHRINEENTYVNPTTGYRQCRLCRRLSKRKSRTKANRRSSPSTHCSRGHSLEDEDNVYYIGSSDAKRCVTCKNIKKKGGNPDTLSKIMDCFWAAVVQGGGRDLRKITEPKPLETKKIVKSISKYDR